MRCPYCGGLNVDQARFCTGCGRDMVPQKPGQAATGQRYQQPQGQRPAHTSLPSYTQPSNYAQPRTPVQQPQRPASAPAPARTAVPVPAKQQVAAQAPARQRETPMQAPPAPPSQSRVPDAPAPFPPRTIEQLKALTSGALSFTVADESVVNGRKKVISIIYPRCAPWQQVATLLKALEQYRSDKSETVVIQGVRSADALEYGYTNGQVRFDRNVPLGSQKINRYQIETGGSLDAESVRIVLTE